MTELPPTAAQPKVSYSARHQSWPSYLIALTTLLLYFGFLGTLPLTLTLLFVYTLVTWDVVAVCVSVGLITLAVFPKRVHAWPWFIFHPVWDTWREYFSFEAITSTELDPNRRYIFAEFPHGVFTMGAWLSMGLHHSLFPNVSYCKGLGADACFLFPLMRQVYGWMGIVSASAKSLEENIHTYNIALVPGGIAELFYSTSAWGEETVFLKKRKGFVRMALKHGADLVPVYHFGNTRIFKRLSSHRGWFTSISRKLRTAIFFCWGRWCTPIPYQHPIKFVVGRPIKVSRNEHPTQKEIDELHSKFQEALVELFNSHKHIVGWDDAELHVL